VYGYLCDLIEANHAVVLGTNNAHLPRLISFFAEALFREAVPTDHPVMSRILSIVREIQVSTGDSDLSLCSFWKKMDNNEQYVCHFQNNETMFQATIMQLTTDQQQALHQALSTLS
jgi:hypothetical protein